MRPLLAAILALPLLACEDRGINWQFDVAPSGARVAWPDVQPPPEVMAEWPNVEDRAVAHLTKYQGVTEERVRYWINAVRNYIHPERWQMKPSGPYYSGAAWPQSLAVEAAWMLPTNPIKAAAFGHEIGHILYWYDVSPEAGTKFEHGWKPPLVSGAALSEVGEDWSAVCAGCRI